MEAIEAPGVKIAATPAAFELRDVGFGDDPAAEDEDVVEPTLAQLVDDPREQRQCAPDRTDRPTASASSCSAVSATCSGVWNKPV